MRFDGATFRPFPEGSEKGVSIAPVLGLTADTRGTLWARLGGAKVVRYSDGRLESLLSLETTEDAVTAMARGKDGGILLSGIVNGILASRRGRLEPISPGAKLPARSPVISMSQAADGRIWLGTQDEGLFSLADGRVTPVKAGLPDRKVNVLLAVGPRDVWVGTDHGLVRWNGAALSAEGVAPPLKKATVSAMIADRESNVWIGTPEGLWRANARGASLLEERDGSAAASVTALFEDRDGSLWVGSSRGLERLRDSSFTTYGRAEGLPAESSGPIHADAAGRTWFAPSSGGLYWLRSGRARRVDDAGLADDVVYSIAASRDGLWVGRRAGGLSHLSVRGDAITARTYRRADGLAEDSVYAVHEGRDGAVWAGTLGSGVSRFHDGRFTTFNVESGLPSNTVTSIADTADGTTWVATPNGLAAFAQGRWTVYAVRQGLPSDDLNCLFEDSTGVLWIGTGDGLASIVSGRVRVPEGLAAARHEQVFGLAEDRQGWLWIATSRRVLRVRRDQLRENQVGGQGVAEYGVSDGLLTTEAAKRHRSVVSDPFGRIWFSMSRGLSVIDPIRATGSAAPLMARLEGLSADGIAVALDGLRRLAPGSRRVTFGYSGVNLSAPERIRFRYRLDGFDSGWSEPVSAREAVYTNLGPGAYQFRVMASNSEGLWNGAEAATAIEIAPFVWQTRWFRSAVLLAAAVVLLVLYRMRLHRLTRQITVRFEERLAERTRIAQDLHDTLLQGFLSASMQLHVAVDQIPPDRPEKARLGGVISLMARVIDEGRNAVRGLRSSEGHYDDLEQSFARIRDELGLANEAIVFRVAGRGRSGPCIRSFATTCTASAAKP